MHLFTALPTPPHSPPPPLSALFFLFGGLWSPPSQMFAGAQWFCYIDPIVYTFRALIPQQFQCNSGTCTKIIIPRLLPSGAFAPILVDRYQYVSTKYEVYTEAMWASLGYLALFILAFQVMAFFSLRYVRHISR
jgi:hypothetical protein